MRILITRPQEAAIRLAKQLKKLGHDVIIDPLIHLTPIPQRLLNLPSCCQFEGIAVTSPYAVQCLAKITSDRDFPLWCVGPGSAQLAKEFGFQTIHKAQGTAKNLTEKLVQAYPSPPQKPILHLSGDTIRFHVIEALQAHKIPAQRIIIYKAQEAGTFSQETQQALKSRTLDAVLFYSPRTAHVFQNLCQTSAFSQYCTSLMAFCLSDVIKEKVSYLPWKDIQIAKNTSTDELLMILMRQAYDGP